MVLTAVASQGTGSCCAVLQGDDDGGGVILGECGFALQGHRIVSLSQEIFTRFFVHFILVVLMIHVS